MFACGCKVSTECIRRMKFVMASARALVSSSLQDQLTNFPTHWKVDFVNDTYDVSISTTDGLSNDHSAL